MIIPICFPAVEIYTFVEKPQSTIISFQNYKHWYLIHTWSDKAILGTVVNRVTGQWIQGFRAGLVENKWQHTTKYCQCPHPGI